MNSVLSKSRLRDLLQKEKLSRKELSDGYIRLLGERDRATRVALLWNSSLLTVQDGFNAILSEDVPQDLKDIYLFLGGVNAIVSIYSYFNKTDYEQYYLRRQQALNVGFILSPEGKDTKAGLALTKTW